MNKYHL